MVDGLISQFLSAVERGELDYRVVDMPPGTGDAALTLTQKAPLSGAVIVTTANDLSCSRVSRDGGARESSPARGRGSCLPAAYSREAG